MSRINDDEFARMVAEEVKNKLSPIQRQELMLPENWGRWKKSLIALSENLQNQIEDIESDADSDEQRFTSMGRNGARLQRESRLHYDQKATRVKRFKFHVDKRLDEVSVMIDTGKEIENDGWKEVDFLKRAIVTHRNLLREFDLEETEIDRALWATLDNKWLFDSISEHSF